MMNAKMTVLTLEEVKRHRTARVVQEKHCSHKDRSPRSSKGEVAYFASRRQRRVQCHSKCIAPMYFDVASYEFNLGGMLQSIFFHWTLQDKPNLAYTRGFACTAFLQQDHCVVLTIRGNACSLLRTCNDISTVCRSP